MLNFAGLILGELVLATRHIVEVGVWLSITKFAIAWQLASVVQHLLLLLVVLLDELLEDGHLLRGVRVVGVLRNHVARKDQNHLAIGHLLIIEGVDLGQELLYVILSLKNVHHAEQILELNLTDDAVLVIVHRLEQVGELDEESLVLLQLEVEDDLFEVGVLEFGALSCATNDLIVELFACHLLCLLRSELVVLLA